MAQLDWDLEQVESYLGSNPDTDTYSTYHRFILEDERARLELTIWQFERVLRAELYPPGAPDGAPLYGSAYAVRGPVQLAERAGRTWLAFHRCVVIHSRFAPMAHGDALLSPEAALPELTLEVCAPPYVQLDHVRAREP